MESQPPDWDGLARALGGTLLIDGEQRERFASDESIYRRVPLAVVKPANEMDVATTLKFARQFQLGITARAGGTSLAGQAVGSGILLDLSNQFEQILEVDVARESVRVQPGVVLSALNAKLLAHGKRFGPDPSSMESCRIGGMIANNASGLHHLRWGATVDNLRSLRLMLSNGDVMVTEPVEVDGPRHRQLCETPGLVGEVWLEAPQVLAKARASLGASWAHYEKSSSGYRLDKALEGNVFDPGKLMCGSEGTLALVLEAELAIVEVPSARGLLILYFATLEDAARGVEHVLPTKPSAVELIDENVVTLFRQRRPDLARRFPDGATCALLIEWMGPSNAKVEEGMLAGYRILREETALAIGDEATTDAGTMESIWQLRRGVEPLLSEMAGQRVPVGFVEDTAVPVARLAEHVRGLYEIFARHGLRAAAYGHASMGHLHVRPFLDLREPKDRALMQQVAAEVFAHTKRMGGTMSGEHGDGLLRSEFLKSYFGHAYDAMAQIKQLFDPEGILNPGIKVGAAEGAMLTHLKAASARRGP